MREILGTERDLFAVEVENNLHLVYAPLDRRASLVDSESLYRLVMSRSTDQALGSASHLPREDTPVGPVDLTLLLTTACNLRCTYCYASAGDRPAEFMSEATAWAAVEWGTATAKRRGTSLSLGFHGGGEPSLNWDVLVSAWRRAVDMASEDRIALAGYVATNGVLAQERAIWVARNLSGASVSLDGLPSTSDRNRPSARGGSSWEECIATLRVFDTMFLPYGVRMTVTGADIQSMVASVAFICGKTKCRRIQIEPVFQKGRGEVHDSIDVDSFRTALREARTAGRLVGCDVVYSGGQVDRVSNDFCGLSTGAVAIMPTGRVSSCVEAFSESDPSALPFAFGRLDHGKLELEAERRSQLDRRQVQNLDHCQDCIAKWHCSGDCAQLGELESSRFAGSARCDLNRAVVVDSVLELVLARSPRPLGEWRVRERADTRLNPSFEGTPSVKHGSVGRGSTPSSGQ